MITIGRPVNADPPRRDDRLIVVLLAFLTVLCYARSLGNGFINYDDTQYVTDAPRVQGGLSLANVGWAFRTTSAANYHPLAWLSHMLDVELYGLAPAGHHLTSVLLHAANVCLLFVLLRRMTGRVWPSAFAAALFAVHPLHVESVAWVAERKDVLSLFFGLLTLNAYATYARQPSALRYTAVMLFFALGLLSKPMLVTLPFAMLLLDYWPLARLRDNATWRHCVLEKLPLIAMAVAASMMTIIAQRGGSSIGGLDRYPLGRRLANAIVAYVEYLRKTVWPTDLSVFYPYPNAFPRWQVLGAAFVLIAITGMAIALLRKRPYVAVAWFWFLGTLVPVIGLVQVGRQAMADRYTYLPHIGLFMVIAWGAAELADLIRIPRQAAAALAGMILLALSARTVVQLGYWSDSTTLFTRALALNPSSYVAHHQLANELARDNQLNAAERHYRAALDSYPQHARSYLNLGNVFTRQKRLVDAEVALREATRLDPSLARAHLSLGLVLMRRQKFAEAEASFAAALEREPTLALAHYQWGLALREQKRPHEAAQHFRSALTLQPTLEDAQRALNELKRAAATRPAATTFSRPPPPL
jgi:protein O-mannosyl-transferase